MTITEYIVLTVLAVAFSDFGWPLVVSAATGIPPEEIISKVNRWLDKLTPLPLVMKNKIKYILAATVLLLCAGYSQAQTNAPTFFNSLEGYFTSFNTNYDISSATIECDTGYKQVTGVGAANVLNLQYNVTLGGSDRFHIKSSDQFSGVGSAFNDAEIGIGYDLIQYYDTELEFNMLGGYSWTEHSAIIDPELEVKKLMTPNTYSGIGISLPFYPKGRFNNTPTFEIIAGFKF